MRTAIISTEFWESDEIASLNSDTRSIYMCLLTNPKRNTTNVFKLSNRLISFYSGFNTDVVKTCLKQLSDDNYIIMVDGYFILTGQEYVKAKRGRLTSDIEDSFLASLPEKVKETLINNNISSREALEHSLVYKHNNNNKDKDNTNNKTKYNYKDKELAELLEGKVISNFSGTGEINIDVWADDVRKLREIDKYTHEQIEFMIKWVQGGEYQGQNLPEHSFWSANIRSVAKLRKQKETIMAQIQQQHKLSNGIIKQQGTTPLIETI